VTVLGDEFELYGWHLDIVQCHTSLVGDLHQLDVAVVADDRAGGSSGPSAGSFTERDDIVFGD
jgi:hypothetical protein